MHKTATRYFLRTLAILVSSCLSCGLAPKQKPAAPDKWELKFTENFSGAKPNPRLWRRIEGNPSGPDWLKNISTREDLVAIERGALVLKGIVNDDPSSDPRRVIAGGVYTRGTFNMKYGKLEMRVRFEGCKGAWPAIWMMPEKSPNGWPNDGEIDIIERLNHDPFVYQTVHSAWAEAHPSNPPRGGRGVIKPDAWNIFTLEWTPETLVWRVNGKVTHTYKKIGDDHNRWPWTAPFYLLIDMQLGGKWVGEVDEASLPAKMYVDWIKFYQLTRGSKRISSFTRPNGS